MTMTCHYCCRWTLFSCQLSPSLQSPRPPFTTDPCSLPRLACQIAAPMIYRTPGIIAATPGRLPASWVSQEWDYHSHVLVYVRDGLYLVGSVLLAVKWAEATFLRLLVHIHILLVHQAAVMTTMSGK